MNKELLSVLKDSINKLINEFGVELKQIAFNRILEYQVETFNRNLFVKTILHSNPANLKEIYQPLSLKVTYSQDRVDEWGKKIDTSSTKKLFELSRFITIIGSAGSGKSMLIKYLFVNSIEENFKIPIKIELRYLNKYEGHIKDYIFEKIFKFQGLGVSDRKIEEFLSKGDFVFFFDGYDEINSERVEDISKQIDEFTARYSQNYFLLTSRPYANIEMMPLFHNYLLRELEEEEIGSLIRKQKLQKELAEKIVETVNKDENRSYRSFLSNPLLLSMYVLSFQTYAQVPQQRSEFYRLVVDTLYSRHDANSKLGYEREKKSGLGQKEIETVLESFCYITFFNQYYHFNKDLIFQLFDILKQNKPIKFDNQDLLDDLTIAISILSIEGTSYLFPHRAIQEYFAAKYIANLGGINKRKAYSHIKNNFVKSPKSDLYNFFSLLKEVDVNDYVPRLLVPSLDFYLDKFSERNVSKLNVSEIIELYFRDMYFVDTLIDSYENKFSINEEERKISQKIHDLFDRKRNEENPDETKYDNELNSIISDEVKPYLLRFHQSLFERVNAIEEEGEVLKEGDNKLINIRIYNKFNEED